MAAAATERKGSLAQGDLQKYRSAFDALANNNSTVKGSDLHKIASKLGYRITRGLVDEMLGSNRYDADSDIDFIQFMKLIPQNTYYISEEEHRLADIREKFQRYDLDGNGSISLSEAQWALQSEMQVSPQTALRLLNQFVELNYEQFTQFYSGLQHKKIEIYEKFGKYDKNKDGLISIDEAHAILETELGFTKEKTASVVKRFDRNQDGVVSYIEFAEFYIAIEERKDKIRNSFKRFDPDDKGFVSVEHARKVLQEGLGFSGDKCEKTISHYDKAGDGKIDYEAFIEFYTMMEEERQRLLTEFHRYDDNDDGRISYDEFQTMLTSLGHSEDEIRALMLDYDSNNDGFLDFDEFKKYLNFN